MHAYKHGSCSDVFGQSALRLISKSEGISSDNNNNYYDLWEHPNLSMLVHSLSTIGTVTTGRSAGGITKERWQKVRKWGIS